MKTIGVCIFVLSLGVQVNSKGCSLPLATSDEEHLPVIEDNSRSKPQLLLPEHGNIELNVGDTILLACTNTGNRLTICKYNLNLYVKTDYSADENCRTEIFRVIPQTSSQSAEATCVRDERISISNQVHDYQNVVCSKSLRGTALKTDRKCGGGNGYVIKLGFPTDGDQFLTLIEVCYDADNGNALYSTHLIYGTRINYASKSSYRPSFSTAELADGVAANLAYKQVTQKALFNTLLGSAKLAALYINKKSYLARGHLSPDADFLFASWQYSTYFYVNTIPQWQAVNNGNWKKLESLSKKVAAAHREDMRVYTGGYRVLSLPNVNNVDTEIHLSNGKLAVPKFVWKILHSEVSRKAIAFVLLNNPFSTELTRSDMLCTDICDEYGWGSSTWNNGEKGFVYCCDARALLKVITTGPKINVKGILAYQS